MDTEEYYINPPTCDECGCELTGTEIDHGCTVCADCEVPWTETKDK